MRSATLLTVVLACLVLTSTGRAADGWETDWTKAKAAAAKDGKDILLDFTGSDWCGWCIRLGKEVFSQEAFKTYAAANLVLMEADYPRQTELSPELKAQNNELREQFGVTGYPTIFLTDAQGRPFARTGYRAGGAEPYVAYLKEQSQVRVTRDTAMAAAQAAQGLERAKLLVAALEPLPVALLSFYADVTAEIQALDKDNQTGFKVRLLELELTGLEGSVRRLASTGKQTEALAIIDDFIARNAATGELQQKALLAKLSAYPPKDQANLAAAEALVDQIVAIDSATATAKQCAALKERIAQIKQRLAAPPPTEAPAKPAEKPAEKPVAVPAQ